MTTPLRDTTEEKRHKRELDKEVEKYKGQSYGDNSFGFINAVIFGENLTELDASLIIDHWHKAECSRREREAVGQALTSIRKLVQGEADRAAMVMQVGSNHDSGYQGYSIALRGIDDAIAALQGQEEGVKKYTVKELRHLHKELYDPRTEEAQANFDRLEEFLDFIEDPSVLAECEPTNQRQGGGE